MRDRDTRPAVDSSVLDDACEGKQDLRRELVRLYLADSQHQLSAARDAVRGADHERLRVTAFAMKLNAVNIGAGPLAELGLELHGATRRGDLEEASSLLVAVSAEFERVREALRRPRDNPD